MNSPFAKSEGTVPAQAPIRVLVVDDSAFVRFTITKHLAEKSDIQVVGAARDGVEALELIEKYQPDVITMDVEMPRLDGLSTLKRIMESKPRPVIMLSSLTSEGAVETIQALTIGAVDFTTKPENKANISQVMDEVANKIRRAAKARVRAGAASSLPVPKPILSSEKKPIRTLRSSDRVVLIGSSTGGPQALNALVPTLRNDLPAAFVIVQHMPAGFTHSLAERLDALSKLKVKEAHPGDKLQVGQVLMAPGGFHMLLDDKNEVVLNQNPTVHGVRPAVDVTLTSLAQKFGNSMVVSILTGMGSDGTNGCALVHQAGGYVIAQDEASSVVWGMPRSVVESKAADEVVSLGVMGKAIERAVER